MNYNKYFFNIILTLSISLNSVGFAKDTKISAYLIGSYKVKNEIIPALKSAGFEVLGNAFVNKSKKHEVIFYTNKALLNLADNKNRGFAAVQRVLIDSEKKQLMFTNPHYFLRAFLQQKFKINVANDIKNSLVLKFGKLKITNDVLDKDDIAGYHFMTMMPYYDDFEEVGEGKQDVLLKRIEERASTNIIFKKKIGNKYLLAVTLEQNIEGLVDKLEAKHKSILLPYLVIIDKSEARILHAKYYLAISLPKLSMGEFMVISDIPGEIEDAFEAFFK